MTIQNIINAEPGWFSVYVEAEAQLQIEGNEAANKLSSIEIRPVACWAQLADGTVKGLAASQDGPLESAEANVYTKTKPNGHLRYIHQSMLDRGMQDPQEAALALVLRDFEGASSPVAAGFPGERTAG